MLRVPTAHPALGVLRVARGARVTLALLSAGAAFAVCFGLVVVAASAGAAGGVWGADLALVLLLRTALRNAVRLCPSRAFEAIESPICRVVIRPRPLGAR